MAKTIAVFGAGPGLSASVAHRFGRAGYRVALVARRDQRLRQLTDQLASAGVEATPFPADLSQPGGALSLVESIEAGLGPVGVMYYGPLAADQTFYPAFSLDVATQQALLNLFFLTPVALVQAVLPSMLEQGDGAVLVAQGLTANYPMAGMSGLGPAMAATRNYIYSLFGELKERGVYAGTVTIKAGIDRSEMTALRRSRGGLGASIPAIDPDDLADRLWDLVAQRDRPELDFPA